MRKAVDDLRGKCCKRVISACVANDTWGMARFAEVNAYLFSLISGNNKT